LLQKFERLGNLADISEAISILQQAVQITPNGHADLPVTLNNLGNSFQSRFERMGDLSDLSEAISAQQHAVQLTSGSHPLTPTLLSNLGNSFQLRFARMGDLSDLSEAISIQQRAVRYTHDSHPYMPGLLNNLGISFQSRFARMGDLSDLSEAISAQQRAVRLTSESHPHMPSRLNNLGVSFRSRFARMGDLSDISEAISVQQRAVHLTPDGHPDKPPRLTNLGNSFESRFAHMGDLSDLSEAILAHQRAVRLTPDGHPHMPGFLNNLGNSFWSRFSRMGDLSDISEAISAHQRAVQLTPDTHPDFPSWMNNLGSSFESRFQRTGDISDISEAISVQQRAVQLTPDTHSLMPTLLNNLGVSSMSRFVRMGDLSDISKAISVQQRAVQLTPDTNPDMPSLLNNLGISFRSRFERMGDLSDLSDAISAHQHAVQLTSDNHPHTPGLLSNLGISFQYRFERMGDLSDLSEAISSQQRAVQLTPDGHPHIPVLLINLGNSFRSRFTQMGDSSDRNAAIEHYKTAATTLGPPSVCLTAAQNWAQLTTNLNDPAVMEAYSIAIDLISKIAGMDRTVEQRHADLVKISSLTPAATSVAFGRGEPEKALEWLEQGRCLVWGQINQLRTPVDDLLAHDAHLAHRFLEISNALEYSGSRRGLGTLSIDATMSQKVTLQDEARIHINLANEWKKLLGDIHNIPGFRNFLRPPQASELLRNIPPDGPIILINVDKSRCDALALISGCPEPIHIPLAEFTYEQAFKLNDRLRNFLSWNGVRAREEIRAIRPAPSHHVESDIHFVLGVLWLEVVRPILEGLSYSVGFIFIVVLSAISHAFCHKLPASLGPRRIWWCPTGPLAFLPLHAAGIYGKARDEKSAPGSCISDFAISSYTPTVSALLRNAMGSTGIQPPSAKLLMISQPNTPGCSPIKGTVMEMNAIRKIIEPKDWRSLCLEGEVATVSRVQLEMASHPSIHFACHASQDVEDPLKSGFYLHDGRLELAEIMKQNITNCELAFLSACQTSTGDEKLSEEAVHLAAGMLAVGYRSVVATMWSIKDEYGPVVAEGFYKDLVEKGTTSGPPVMDSANASRALHRAIQAIRQQVGDTEQGLLTWVPYVHFGY